MLLETITIEFPMVENEDGILRTLGVTDTTKVVDQNIKMVLLTSPGEWLGNSSFGVGLRKYLFENPYFIESGNADSGLLPLRQNILTQLSTFIPYITVQDLQISNAENFLSVKLKYFINDTSLASEFVLEINNTVNYQTLNQF